MRLSISRPSSTERSVHWLVGLTQLLSWGVFYYSLPVFVAPISADLGWSRELLFAGLSAALLTAVLTAPLVGGEIDRGRGRRVMLAGQLLGTLALSALSVVHSAPLFLILCCVLGVSQAATLYDAAFSLLHRRLAEDAPQAIIRVTLIAGFAGTVFVPGTQFCADEFGWRAAAVIIAAAGLAALALTALALPPDAPEERRQGSDCESAPALEGIRWTPAMIAILVAFAASTAVFSTITIHFVPLLIDRGLPGLTAAQFFALVGPAQSAARFLLFIAPPQTPALRFGTLVFLLQALAIILLMAGMGGVSLFAFAILFGASSGLLTIVRGLAPAEICARGMIGRLNGGIGAAGGLARALMPAAFAFSLTSLGASASLAILLMLSLTGALAFAAIAPLQRRGSVMRRA